jgi:hypothetical protein
MTASASMRRRRIRSSIGALAVAISALAACSASPATPTPPTASPAGVPTPAAAPSTPAPTSTPAATPSPSPTASISEVLPREAFGEPTTVDNPYFPLVPGTQLVYRGAVGLGDERESHRVVFTVTDQTKIIDGVQTVVVYDVDYTPAKRVAEVEIAFFAQDDEGNVWLMGEFPAEYEDGKIVDAPAWISGLDGATAGIIMPTEPSLTAPSYAQGWAPSVEFTDRARTFELGSRTCVKTGCYEDVLVNDEFNPSEPDSHQLKYYAPGVGPVRVGWAGAMEPDREVLELARVVQLDGPSMAKLRETVLAFDARARTLSPDVYALTEPLQGP